ncbi:MAG: UDP-N-acetylmuramate dehydrogenase [Bacilli bacterium]|nr:UDP-N-acetylmuramate dehydrogenase [Bacilli bacterium]
MKYKRLIRFLKKNKIEHQTNVNLVSYNSLKIKAISKIFIKLKSIENLQVLLSFLNKNKINFYLLGNGSNTLFVDKIIHMPVIKLDFDDKVVFNNGFVLVNANISNIKFANILKNNEYSGFEFASVIPGTIGAGIVLNASYDNQSFSDRLMYVEAIDSLGNIKWICKEDIRFSYRNSSLYKEKYIITRAIFKLDNLSKKEIIEKMNSMKEKKALTQPIEYPNCGSIFKNGQLKAFEYINGVGLKEYRKNGAMISSKHSNFIINFNNATGKDVLFIIEKAIKKVYDKYKVNLILEITLVRSHSSVK